MFPIFVSNFMTVFVCFVWFGFVIIPIRIRTTEQQMKIISTRLYKTSLHKTLASVAQCVKRGTQRALLHKITISFSREMEPILEAVIVHSVPQGLLTSLFLHPDPPGSVSCLIVEGNPQATLAPLQKRDGLPCFPVQ